MKPRPCQQVELPGEAAEGGTSPLRPLGTTAPSSRQGLQGDDHGWVLRLSTAACIMPAHSIHATWGGMAQPHSSTTQTSSSGPQAPPALTVSLCLAVQAACHLA